MILQQVKVDTLCLRKRSIRSNKAGFKQDYSCSFFHGLKSWRKKREFTDIGVKRPAFASFQTKLSKDVSFGFSHVGNFPAVNARSAKNHEFLHQKFMKFDKTIHELIFSFEPSLTIRLSSCDLCRRTILMRIHTSAQLCYFRCEHLRHKRSQLITTS